MNMASKSITEFLLERIAEDEDLAKNRDSEAHIHQSGCYYYNYTLDANWHCDCDEDGAATARVLAECAAKRAIIEQSVVADELDQYQTDDWPEPRDLEVQRACGDLIRRNLAAIYADHPDYQQEWAL